MTTQQHQRVPIVAVDPEGQVQRRLAMGPAAPAQLVAPVHEGTGANRNLGQERVARPHPAAVIDRDRPVANHRAGEGDRSLIG